MKIRRVPLIGMQIRGVHPYCFRSGEWASIVGIVHVTPDDEGLPERLCWNIGFDDGVYDHWPMCEEYEFRESA